MEESPGCPVSESLRTLVTNADSWALPREYIEFEWLGFGIFITVPQTTLLQSNVLESVSPDIGSPFYGKTIHRKAESTACLNPENLPPGNILSAACKTPQAVKMGSMEKDIIDGILDFRRGEGSKPHLPKNGCFNKGLSERLVMQQWPQLCSAQTDAAQAHDLHPSHGFDFCGISDLAFSKTRSLSLCLRVNGIFINNAHKMPSWGIETLDPRVSLATLLI